MLFIKDPFSLLCVLESFPGHCDTDVSSRNSRGISKKEDHWSCIAHLIAEDMLKSVVIEKKTFKHSPWAGADNQLGPKF